jgi:hypothetical protein
MQKIAQQTFQEYCLQNRKIYRKTLKGIESREWCVNYSLGLSNLPRKYFTLRKSRVNKSRSFKQGDTWCKMAEAGFQSFAILRTQIWVECHTLFRPVAFCFHMYSGKPQSVLKWTLVCGIPHSICPRNATRQVDPLSRVTAECHWPCKRLKTCGIPLSNAPVLQNATIRLTHLSVEWGIRVKSSHCHLPLFEASYLFEARPAECKIHTRRIV